ncbi:hypothetical protein BsWGS_14049 [Bradybaena similaris]
MSSQHRDRHHPVQTQPAGHPGGQRGAYHGNPYGGDPRAGGHTNTTTVVIQQPGVRDWSSGICDCTDDMGICLCAMFCGICLSMQVSADMGEFMCLPCCVPDFLVPLRVKMRTQERIQGSICNDCLIVNFCGSCALCQLAREVKMVKQQGRM